MPRKQAKSTADAEPADGPIQFLSPEGVLEPDSRLELPSRIDGIDLLALYRDMALVRRLDSEAIALQRQGELGLWPSLRGQEAAQVGAAYALAEQDMVFPTYREHGVAWCRGLDPVSLLGLFRGSTLGGWNPYERRFGLYNLVIGAQTLHAVGYGMGLVRDDAIGSGDDTRDTAVLVFLGDGALSEGETNEAFLWAAAQNLPVVFFCQNNQWAISAPYSVQSRVPVAQRATGFGFPGVSVDGNDVLACLGATSEALTRARSGGGPTLIEAVTYRINAHTTADDATRYRPSAETEEWTAKDPLERLRLHLTASGGADEAFFADIERREQELAEHLRAGCRALPAPDDASSFENTYTEMPAELRRQLAEHTEFLAAGFLADQEIGATR
ncbi:thiamine pyrophosphate-dependent dehydrogenase E1 component subunit alpha [Streptomyces sp. NBC_00878]|uniref:thiamine pyrophosphate-dependent dehydrogenase E1 component subunit alpha n=1 Tax=Streptomyces sp. NBC_00878 TaxID=2975854 RepID=UPI00225475B9|nr:thiamine pyrophosphate-dependent dehydrogenase E1 component subunit alpha [Streptomyces sp. NBC_00878]MCX4903395.1 thiamine pyrophosphate-dependent dehydrogenase E1 component subunit alpha [Streptomyces sp. NBC_00878]